MSLQDQGGLVFQTVCACAGKVFLVVIGMAVRGLQGCSIRKAAVYPMYRLYAVSLGQLLGSGIAEFCGKCMFHS